MLWVLSILVMVSFGLYAFFDAMTITARTAASLEGRNAAGASLEKIMNTLKRFSMFIYPPILGFIILSGETRFFMLSIYGSFALATIIGTICLFQRSSSLGYFRRVTLRFSNGQNVSGALLLSFRKPPEKAGTLPQHGLRDSIRMNRRLYFFATGVYFFYASAIFFLNLISLIYADAAVILLQMLGLINGVGTILLAFIVDPVISRKLDNAQDLDALSVTVLLSQLTTYALLGPAAFAICDVYLL